MLAFIDKRTYLSESLQLSLGRLGDDVEAQADDAQRAATAMWRDDPDADLAAELGSLRREIRDRTRTATMCGYGPRYLHSTGQLHKGGPNTGVFVLITATPRADVSVPGELFSFGTLELAQALGDFASLDATGRRALHAHLPALSPPLIRTLAAALLSRIEAH